MAGCEEAQASSAVARRRRRARGSIRKRTHINEDPNRAWWVLAGFGGLSDFFSVRRFGLRIVLLTVAIKARSPSASPTAWAGTGPAMGLFHLLGDGPLRLVARLLAIRDRVTAGMCCQQLSRLSKSGCYGRRSLLPQNARLGSLTLCLRVS